MDKIKNVKFIIPGCARCGSTSLYGYLKNHKDIISAKNKETNFFNYHYNNGLDWYLNQYSDEKNKTFFEASINYIAHNEVPKRIFDFNKNIKLIFMFRNPVKRCYSHYYMIQRGNKTVEDFDKEIGKIINKYSNVNFENPNVYKNDYYFTRSVYYYQLKWWLKYFKKSQIYILKSEDLFTSPDFYYKDILNFLELPQDGLQEYKIYNPKSRSPHGTPPPLNKKTYKLLEEFYKPFNEKFYNLIERDMKW